MLSKTQIIILHTIKHSDTGIVVQAYSDTLGKTAFYFFASKKHRNTSLLSPLNILDAVIYKRGGSDGQYNIDPNEALTSGSGLPLLKELSPVYPLHGLHGNITKSSIAVYICEFITKTIREIEANPDLYNFLASSIQVLDSMTEGVENFHLHFTANYCKIMGYMPYNNYSAENMHFNFTTARFQNLYQESLCFTPEESLLLNNILTTPLGELNNIKCSGELRNQLIQSLLNYITFHTGSRMELKSLPVLREVFE